VKLNELKPAPGSKKSRRRVGRGLGSGRGKTAGRGQKGQSSRSGFSQGRGWEGGRSRLIMRLPKRGFSKVKLQYQIVNVGDLNGFEPNTEVNVETLVGVGLVRHFTRPVKLLAGGSLEVAGLKIEVDAASAAAINAIVAQGGEVTIPSFDEEAAAEGATEVEAAADVAKPAKVKKAPKASAAPAAEVDASTDADEDGAGTAENV
jgi:large subunit ribosomal protein L15